MKTDRQGDTVFATGNDDTKWAVCDEQRVISGSGHSAEENEDRRITPTTAQLEYIESLSKWWQVYKEQIPKGSRSPCKGSFTFNIVHFEGPLRIQMHDLVLSNINSIRADTETDIFRLRARVVGYSPPHLRDFVYQRVWNVDTKYHRAIDSASVARARENIYYQYSAGDSSFIWRTNTAIVW